MGSVFHLTTVYTCGEDSCETDVILPSKSLVCPFSTVIVTADNGFGQRLLSDPITIGMSSEMHQLLCHSLHKSCHAIAY